MLSRAVDDHPNEALFLQELARTHLQAGNHQLAYDCAKRADEIAPDSDVTARILGLALVRLGRSAEALSVFEAHGGVGGDEELRKLTAVAIIGMAEARFEPVSPDLAGPTSQEAAEAVISLMDRVRAIDGLHEEERSAAEQLRQAATDALGKRYLGGFASVVSHLGLSFLVFIVVLLASSQSVLAVLAAIALLAVLTIRRIQPGWKGFREAAEAYRRSGAEG